MWPDYCKKETPARRLDLEIGAVDQYVKRGSSRHPHKVGEALLLLAGSGFYLRGGNTAESEHVDPTTPEHAVPPKLPPHRRPGPETRSDGHIWSDEVQGTLRAEKAIRLPDDPRQPEF